MKDFLEPVSEEILEYTSRLSELTIGRQMKKHTPVRFPEMSAGDIALLTIEDAECTKEDYIVFRKNLYGLYPGNWMKPLVDLGTLKAGGSFEEVCHGLREITEFLLKEGILLIVLGAKQELVYPMYRAFDHFEQMVNIASIEQKIDVATEQGYLSRVIMEEPHNLLNYSIIGYQTYYNSQEELALLEQLYFDAHRLGEVTADLTLAEPILRDADMVCLSVASIKSSSIGYYDVFYPNGFDSREVCVLSRYAGISEKVKAFGFFDLDEYSLKSELIAQTIWYFIEGVNYRVLEYPFGSKENYYKYIVPQDDEELIFYKSNQTGRWWIEISYFIGNQEVTELFPCSEKDYDKALENQIPERWWKALQKKIG